MDRPQARARRQQSSRRGPSNARDTAADSITDFSRTQGDRIDLLTIDARTNLAGNQAFAFIGQAALHDVAGELRFSLLNRPGTTQDKTVVQADVNGDGVADMLIYLNGLKSLGAVDFIH